VDYEAFCGVAPLGPPGAESAEIDPPALARVIGGNSTLQLIDVREPWEWQICRLEGARLIPLRELPARAAELDRRRPVVAYCHTGVRSLAAMRLLRERGFADVKSLRGGVEGWATEVDHAMPRY
jgi:adenylyltransferase/sulfurtransferase